MLFNVVMAIFIVLIFSPYWTTVSNPFTATLYLRYKLIQTTANIFQADTLKKVFDKKRFCHGVSVITMADEKELWMESTSTSPFVLLHVNVLASVGARLDFHHLEKCLKLNGKLNCMHGSWLIIHEQTDSLRLCAKMSKKIVEFDAVMRLANNLCRLADGFDKKYIFDS